MRHFWFSRKPGFHGIPVPAEGIPARRNTQNTVFRADFRIADDADRDLTAQCKEEKDLDTLFTGPNTTALVHPIAGLDDFELIAFLIVEDVDGNAK